MNAPVEWSDRGVGSTLNSRRIMQGRHRRKSRVAASRQGAGDSPADRAGAGRDARNRGRDSGLPRRSRDSSSSDPPRHGCVSRRDRDRAGFEVGRGSDVVAGRAGHGQRMDRAGQARTQLLVGRLEPRRARPGRPGRSSPAAGWFLGCGEPAGVVHGPVGEILFWLRRASIWSLSWAFSERRVWLSLWHSSSCWRGARLQPGRHEPAGDQEARIGVEKRRAPAIRSDSFRKRPARGGPERPGRGTTRSAPGGRKRVVDVVDLEDRAPSTRSGGGGQAQVGPRES